MNTVSGWENKYLRDVIKVQGGFAFNSGDYNDEGIPIIRMSDLKGGRININNAVRISSRKLKQLSDFILYDGDFLVGMSGSIGNFAIVRKEDMPAYLNQRVGRFILSNEKQADYEFIKQIARSDAYKSHVELLAAGAAQVNISPSQIESFYFQSPPKSEQSKIAEVLSTVDRAIEQTESLIVKQQRIKTGLMQDLLTRGIDEHGNLRSEETHEFKDSPLGRIPVEWEVKKLSGIVDEKITYGIVQAGPNVENGVPYIRTGDMSDDHISLQELLRTSQKIANSYVRSEVHFGDIVFALRATVGKVLPVTKEIDGANLTQGTAKISPNKSIDANYLIWALRAEKVQSAIAQEMKGTTFMEITLSSLRDIRISLPKASPEQTKIALVIGKLHEYEIFLFEKQNKLRLLKTALMQDLLTGKVRVTPLMENLETKL